MSGVNAGGKQLPCTFIHGIIHGELASRLPLPCDAQLVNGSTVCRSIFQNIGSQALGIKQLAVVTAVLNRRYGVILVIQGFVILHTGYLSGKVLCPCYGLHNKRLAADFSHCQVKHIILPRRVVFINFSRQLYRAPAIAIAQYLYIGGMKCVRQCAVHYPILLGGI